DLCGRGLLHLLQVLQGQVGEALRAQVADELDLDLRGLLALGAGGAGGEEEGRKRDKEDGSFHVAAPARACRKEGGPAERWRSGQRVGTGSGGEPFQYTKWR